MHGVTMKIKGAYSLTDSSRFESSRIDSDLGSNRLRLTRLRQRVFGLLTMAALGIAYTASGSSRIEDQVFGRFKKFDTAGFIFVSCIPGTGRDG
jgi:hypothetical protein